MSALHAEVEALRIEAITAYRLGREAEGSDALVKYVDAIAPLLERSGLLLGADEAVLLQEVMAAQQRGDYLFVGDLLEYLLPATALGGIAAL